MKTKIHVIKCTMCVVAHVIALIHNLDPLDGYQIINEIVIKYWGIKEELEKLL